MRKLFYSAFAAAILFTSVSFAQENRAGKFGIGYSGNFSKNSNSLSGTYWASDKFKIEPEVGVSYTKVDAIDGLNWRLGIGFVYTLSDLPVLPYIGLRAKAIILSLKEEHFDDTHEDLVFTLAFGGEYFVSEWLSAGAEMRINYVDTDGSFSPAYGIAKATIVETEQTINLKIYFN
jgi:hypothetical protein